MHVHVFKKEKERKVKNRILVVLTSLSTKTAYKSILLFWLSVSRLTERIINTHTHTRASGNTAMFRLCQPTHKEEQTLVFTDGSTAAQEAEEKEHASHTKDDVDTGE